MNGILESIDQQIAKLQQARSLLTSDVVPAVSSAPAGKRRGRPKGSVNKATIVAPTKVSPKVPQRTMNEEGKQRIAAAQKAHWAAQKKSVKATGKKISPAKKSARKTVAKPEVAKAKG